MLPGSPGGEDLSAGRQTRGLGKAKGSLTRADLSADWWKHAPNLGALSATHLQYLVVELEASVFVSWTLLHNLGHKDALG